MTLGQLNMILKSRAKLDEDFTYSTDLDKTTIKTLKGGECVEFYASTTVRLMADKKSMTYGITHSMSNVEAIDYFNN